MPLHPGHWKHPLSTSALVASCTPTPMTARVWEVKFTTEQVILHDAAAGIGGVIRKFDTASAVALHMSADREAPRLPPRLFGHRITSLPSDQRRTTCRAG